MKITKKFKKWHILIGIAIFVYIIIYKIDLLEVFEILKQTNLLFVGLAMFFAFIMILAHVYRWNYLKKIQNINYQFKDSFLIYNAGFFFSTITPGHIGDLIRVFYLKKDGYSVGKSFVSIFLDRLADVSFLLIVGYLSMYFFARFFWQYIIVITVIILIGLLVFFLFQRKKFLKILSKKILYFLIPQKYKKSWHLNYQDFIDDIKIYKLKNYFVLYSITIFNWFIYYSSMFLLAKSIGLDNIPFIFLAMSVTIAALATLIPISILGLGTRDATLLLLFSFFNISPEKTIAFSTLYLLIILMAALLGLICWLKKPLKLKA